MRNRNKSRLQQRKAQNRKKGRAGKAKGAKGQKEVQEMILKHFPELHPDDCRSNPIGNPGEDILLSPAARALIPWQIEVKRRSTVSAARYIEQATWQGDYEPVAFFREDYGPWYAVVNADYLFDLLKLYEKDLGDKHDEE